VVEVVEEQSCDDALVKEEALALPSLLLANIGVNRSKSSPYTFPASTKDGVGLLFSSTTTTKINAGLSRNNNEFLTTDFDGRRSREEGR
jgi:hypothetical protein